MTFLVALALGVGAYMLAMFLGGLLVAGVAVGTAVITHDEDRIGPAVLIKVVCDIAAIVIGLGAFAWVMSA